MSNYARAKVESIISFRVAMYSLLALAALAGISSKQAIAWALRRFVWVNLALRHLERVPQQADLQHYRHVIVNQLSVVST